MESKRSPIIVIVGQTGSGKSALAMQLALKYGCEIVCADSRTIYKELDIGTAKPSPEDQKAVPHHCLDLVKPNQKFSAAEFKQRAVKSIKEIHTRGMIPLLVGGSGLYIDSVLFDYQFARAGAERDSQNPRHLKKSHQGVTSRPLRQNTLIIGLQVEREILQERILNRVNNMISAGFIDEVKVLSKKYGWEAPGLLAPGYLAFKDYIAGNTTIEDAKQKFVRNDMSLAKRQLTWFKRNKNIHWIQSFNEADKLVHKFLLRDDTIV